jgi:hypothetical protein
MEGLKRAFLEFHCMREYPILYRSTQIYILLGRNFMGQTEGGLSIKHKGSSETICEIDNNDNNVYKKNLKDEFKS